MKKNRTAKKREHIGSANLLGLLFLPLLVSGCNSHDSRFSYFNMLDSEKITVQNKKAAEKFWSSVRPVSTLSASHYKLGRYYQQQGKYDKAIAEFSKAVRNDSSYCKAYNGIAMTYDALQRCEMASDSYELAMQCAPQESYVYNNYACSSILCGDYEKGLALLSKAGQLSKDNSRIKNNIKLAQMLAEREEKLSQVVLPETTVALAATTALEPPEKNEIENSQTEPMYENAQISAPDETPNGDGVNRGTVETPVKNSAESSAQANNLAAQTPPMEKKEELVSLPKADATVVSKEAELESNLQKNIVIASLIIAKTKKISAQGHKKYTTLYANSAIEVSNGNGVTGMAGRSADYFRCYGFTVGRITNAEYFRIHDSVIFYREGYLQVAEELARLTPGLQAIEKVKSLGRASIGVRILLGKDLASIQFPEGYAQNFAYSRSKTAYNISSTSNMNKLSVTY